jgi:hypothetical protein
MHEPTPSIVSRADASRPAAEQRAPERRRYRAPQLTTVEGRELLEALGPAHANYGGPGRVPL